MNAIIFGGTGMVGQGVLRECLLDPDIMYVVSVVRAPSGQRHARLRDLVHANFFDFSSIESERSGFDAAFYCLGVTSAGKTEAQYSRVTYDITMAAAEPLARLNPGMTFVFMNSVENSALSHSLSVARAVHPVAAQAIPALRHDDGTAWPRDDRCRQAWGAQACAGKRGHQLICLE